MRLKQTLAAMAFATALGSTAVGAMAQTVVGVSWSNFQEERWKTDEAAIKAELEKLGAKYISADAGGSPEKQLGDIEGLMSKGAKALIVLAMDKDAILPAVTKATRQKVPVVAYDRLIEAPGVFYITFDNVEVGRMEAREVFKVKPKGNYVIIKGSPSDPNADFLRAGQQEVLDAAIKKGDIKIVGDEYTEGWKPEVAQKNMEQILTKAGNKVDAWWRPTTARPAARWRLSRPRASAAFRCRARTPTSRRSTASRWARRPPPSSRTRASSAAKPPPRPSRCRKASRSTRPRRGTRARRRSRCSRAC